MNHLLKHVARLTLLVGLVSCLLASQAWAQVVTGTLRGTVKSVDDGSPFAEAEVTLIHVPSGNTKTTLTNADGVFVFSGLRVGGPYHVKAEPMGFKAAEEDDIFLSAGKIREVGLGIRLTEEVVEVTGSVINRNTSARTVVGADEIDSLPSVTRDPRDFVRRNPEASVEGRDRALSVGGANTRFNSVTIDGVRQDDDFGLNQSGYPTRRSPIALSAVEELAVESSPFDVRYGKFLGGNVNIVTKSGTNEFKGQVIGTFAGDSLIGGQSRGDRIAALDFSELRYGATVGGPIVKDKVHFLASIEGLNASTPVDVGPDGSGATIRVSKVSVDEMLEAQRIAREVYGFEAGDPSRGLDEGDLKLLAKIDWAIDRRHRASTTYQRTAGNTISNSFANDTNLPLSSNWFDARDTLHAGSARVLSDWSDRLSTELEVSAKFVSSRPDPLEGNGFMQATIATPAGGRIILGPDGFRHANELDNNVLQARAEANYLYGKHLVSGGIAYEQLRVRNLFVPNSNGLANYSSLADFAAMMPNTLTYSDSVSLNPEDAAASFHTGTIVGYLQDQLKLTGSLAIQGGLRAEVYTSTNNIKRNQTFIDRHGFANDATLAGRSVIMPRVGISYLPFDQLNVRAGAGLYSGGTPGVWVANNFTNDGISISSTTSRNRAAIAGFNGRDIPQALEQMILPGTGDVDALDPDFKIPSVWKLGIGADYSFLKGTELKVNYTFSKANNAVMWQDLRRDSDAFPNNLPVGTTVDGRPLYDTDPAGGAFDPDRGNDMLLTNTSRGHGHSATLLVQKGFPFGLFVAGSYGFQRVFEVSPATSSRSVSNYGLAGVTDPNSAELGVSNYERAHRFTAAVQFTRPLVGDLVDSKPWKNMKTSIGLFVESRSGQPFSWTFADANDGDTLAQIFGEESEFARRNRQLFYVPRGDGSDVTLVGIDAADFDQFLRDTGLDKYRGKIAPRNAFRSSWFSKWDLRIAQDLPNPISKHRARFVFDIENIGNMMNDRWGRVTSVPFPFLAPAVNVSLDQASGKYIYSAVRPTDPNQLDILASVWRMSLGLIYDF